MLQYPSYLVRVDFADTDAVAVRTSSAANTAICGGISAIAPPLVGLDRPRLNLYALKALRWR
jgi:hypothetical protein